MSERRANLEAARALIDKPQKWIRNSDYRIPGRRCVVRAVLDATEGQRYPSREFKALCRALGVPFSVERLLWWNREASHREVLDLLDRAIQDTAKR